VDNDKLIVRDDINFLEYPNWTVAERDGVKELIIKKENGIYKISTTADSLPNRFDKAVLYFLLSGLESDSSEITTTRYKLAKSIFYKTDKVGKIHYNRIMLSLKRWTSIFIEFNGIFYEGNNYTQRYFHIIDDVVLNEKTRELYIKFNQQYIRQLRESNFCKLIDFYEYRKLTKPVTARLFEILTKTFKDRDIWQIHIIKLAEKLTLEKRQDCNTYYPSDVVIKIETATKEIYKETDLKVKLEYDNNTHICTFIKLQDSQEEKHEESHSINIEEDNFKALIAILPTEHQDKKTILEAMSNAFRKHGFDYVKRNIQYSNKHCRNNYRAYLNKALKEDWGLAFKEDEDVKQKQREEVLKEIEEQVRRRTEVEQARQKEQEIMDRIVKYIDDLSSEEREALRHEATIRAEPQTRKMSDQFYVQLAILQKMQEISAERLKLNLY